MIGGAIQYVLPFANNHFAPYANYSGYDIEIENTQFADVYDNLAEDNSAGLLVFDLPGNPVLGRDVDIHDNQIINNNRKRHHRAEISAMPRRTRNIGFVYVLEAPILWERNPSRKSPTTAFRGWGE